MLDLSYKEWGVSNSNGSPQRNVEQVVILMWMWCEDYQAPQLRSSEIRLILSPMAVITHTILGSFRTFYVIDVIYFINHDCISIYASRSSIINLSNVPNAPPSNWKLFAGEVATTLSLNAASCPLSPAVLI